MSAKRSAPYDIDQRTLQPKEQAPESKQQPQPNQSTQDQKQRNIISVKKDTNNDPKPTQNQEQKKEDPKPTSSNLFSNLFTNNSATPASNGSGLFSNTSSSLFTNNSSGLFSKPSGGLFTSSGSNSQPKTGGLFTSNGSTGGSIFNFQNSGVPPVKNTGSSLFSGVGVQGNDEGDSGDSAQLEAGQNLEVDPSKSTVSYKYEQTCQLILKQKAFKFKKIGGDLIQNVDVVLSQDKSSSVYYISVQLPATKRSIYTGLVIKQKSQVKHLNNKNENVEISAFTIVQGKPEQAVLRFQFQKQQQGIELHDTVKQIILDGTFTSKDSKKTENANKKGAENENTKDSEKDDNKKVQSGQTKQDN